MIHQLSYAIHLARNWKLDDVASILIFPAVAILGLCLFAGFGDVS